MEKLTVRPTQYTNAISEFASSFDVIYAVDYSGNFDRIIAMQWDKELGFWVIVPASTAPYVLQESIEIIGADKVFAG